MNKRSQLGETFFQQNCCGRGVCDILHLATLSLRKGAPCHAPLRKHVVISIETGATRNRGSLTFMYQRRSIVVHGILSPCVERAKEPVCPCVSLRQL